MKYAFNEETGMVTIFTPCITRKGKKIYKKDGGLFVFEVPANKFRK